MTQGQGEGGVESAGPTPMEEAEARPNDGASSSEKVTERGTKPVDDDVETSSKDALARWEEELPFEKADYNTKEARIKRVKAAMAKAREDITLEKVKAASYKAYSYEPCDEPTPMTTARFDEIVQALVLARNGKGPPFAPEMVQEVKTELRRLERSLAPFLPQNHVSQGDT